MKGFPFWPIIYSSFTYYFSLPNSRRAIFADAIDSFNAKVSLHEKHFISSGTLLSEYLRFHSAASLLSLITVLS